MAESCVIKDSGPTIRVDDGDQLTSALENLKIGEPGKIEADVRTRTGLIYDMSMVEHKCLWDENYPESPARFTRILERMEQLDLVKRCRLLKPRPATKEEILYIHTEEHYETMKQSATISDPTELEALSAKFDAIYFYPKTNELALLAAGSTIQLIDAVLKEEIKNGFALVRPPGHHAFSDKPCGYCFYNNIAIGAAHAVKNHGLERVLIVDWDVHHGQATQFSFEDDPKVLYFSIHKYLHGSYWPELIESNYTAIGRGAGKGYNINVPLNEEELTDYDYLAIFHNILLPVAYEYNPQLILVSAGYDAAIGCPEGKMNLTPALYAHLTNLLMTFAGGKVCVILEGGYCLSSLAESAALTLRCLLGDPCPPLSLKPAKLHKAIVDTILDVIWALKPHWKCFQIQEEFDKNEPPDDTNPLVRRHLPVVEYRGQASFIDPPASYETRNCYEFHDKETFDKFEAEIKYLKDSTDLSVPSRRTCLKYDPNMNEHHCIRSDHPERPSRITRIFNELKRLELVEKCWLLDEPRKASDEEIHLVHEQDYIKKIESTEHLTQDKIDKIASSYDSIYLCKGTNSAARLAVGGLLQIVDKVLTNEAQNGFAVIRPPGHHAPSKAASGFCIFNNISIAVQYAIQKYNIKRALIVDWDVHHGDGTQSIFENNPNVLFMSLHRYDFASFFPRSIKSGFKTCPNVVNVPWNGKPMSDFDYLLAFANIILPIANEFNPEVVFVSSGFDAAIYDPLGECELSPEVYGHFTHLLSGLANGKLIITLEGGYNLTSISSAAANCVSVLLGNPPKPLGLLKLNNNSPATIRDVMGYHASNWSSMAFNAQLPFNTLVD